MLATELLQASVVDASGTVLGPVRDARIRREADGSLTLVGLVVGDGPFAGAAHAWGFAEGRATGPWLFRALTARAVRAARYVPSERVSAWGPGTLTLSCAAAELEHLHPEGAP